MATLREAIAANSFLASLAAAGDYPGVADWLNTAPAVANPVAQGNVPAPVTLEQIMAIVPSVERVKIRAMAGFVGELRTALDTDNRAALAVLLEDGVTAGAITAGAAAQLQPLLTATVPDPAWHSTIPGAPRWQAAGLPGPVTAADVQGACHAA